MIRGYPVRTIGDFAPGDRVRYVPSHAMGDTSHPDCENGVVSSKNDKYVFVRYYYRGGLKESAQATDPQDLIKVGEGG